MTVSIMFVTNELSSILDETYRHNNNLQPLPDTIVFLKANVPENRGYLCACLIAVSGYAIVEVRHPDPPIMLVNNGRYYKKLARFILRSSKQRTQQSLGGTVYCQT